MEKINIFDFLHFFNLIKIKPNMDFGGNLAFCRYMAQDTFIILFYLLRRVEKGSF